MIGSDAGLLSGDRHRWTVARYDSSLGTAIYPIAASRLIGQMGNKYKLADRQPGTTVAVRFTPEFAESSGD